MLTRLTVNNILIIDNISTDFHEGFSTITGETGSGKSIILRSLLIVLGSRASNKLVREDCKSATIIAEFNIANNKENLLAIFEEFGIDYSDNIIIRKNISKDGASRTFLNDISVTANLIQKITEQIIDIQTQNEQSSFLLSSNLVNLLDKYHNKQKQVLEVKLAFGKYKLAANKYEELSNKKLRQEIEKQYLESLLNDLKELEPEENEFDEIQEKFLSIKNQNQILNCLKAAYNSINNDNGAISSINFATKEISYNNSLAENDFSNLEQELIELYDKASNTSDKIEELINKYGDNDFDPNQIRERISLYKTLSRKYKTPEKLLFELYEKSIKEYDEISNIDSELEKLAKELEDLKSEYFLEATKLSKIRKESAIKIEKEVLTHLKELNMEKTQFKIEITAKDEEKWNNKGIDNIKFMISTNPGQPMVELQKSASGGEISRFLLALKLVFAKAANIGTIIFDEIDTGVGGETAKKIANKLSELAKFYQIIAITHQPLLFEKADNNYQLSKEYKDNKTFAKITLLPNSSKKEELQRMLAG